MKLSNEEGITLIELLVTILILGLIVIPISTYLLTGTYTRTISQGKENQLLYFAQEIMEKQRKQSTNNEFTKVMGSYFGECTLDNGCKDGEGIFPDPDAKYKLEVSDSPANAKFMEVKVIVTSTREVAIPVELVSVVKKRDIP